MPPTRFSYLLSAILSTIFTCSTSVSEGQKLTLNPGDRICLIGNTLAERMQYFGHLETMLHARFADHNLVVRNLAFSADEVEFRPRSLDFGGPDDHLAAQKADVVLAFFGFNESFAGPDGVVRFKEQLNRFIQDTASRIYNDKSAARLVLFSPIAHEDWDDPDLADGKENNRNLQLYTATIAEAAQQHQVPFVDLFEMTQQLYNTSSRRLTINGIHLSDEGYRLLAPLLDEALFGERSKLQSGSPNYRALHAEVQEKNFFFFHRYRAVNGYYIYGGRSQRANGNPPFTDHYVLENEREKLDDMVAIRDQRIWRVARGDSVPSRIDDSESRPLHDVPTNFHQPIMIHPPEEALKLFKVAEGYAVNLFASEVEFPELKNPVNITFDARGRLWVAVMPDYPMFQPPKKPNDKILVFEDTDGDGKADTQTVFADGLHVPTGFELGDGGVYVSQQPNLVFLKDSDGDGRADFRELLLHGFDSGDSHHSIGAFLWGPGGGLYMHEGTFHHTSVETPTGPVRNAHGGIYRYDPRRQQFETFVHYNFANPWGHIFDRWGQNFVADASGGENYFGTAFSGKAPQFTGQDDFGPFKFVYRDQMQQFLVKRVRPTAGCEIVSSRHFPPSAQGNFLLNNVIGFQGVLQHTMREESSGFVATEIEPLLFSADPNFRPTDLQFGPDGALYIVDWFNPLVGHMQHNLRDPNRDHTHGRIWRITYPSRPLVEPPKIAGKPIPQLLDLLLAHEDRTRYRVRRELRERKTDDVVAELNRWVTSRDKEDPEYEHHLLEALWVRQHHNAVDERLLKRVLWSPNYHARAAATFFVAYWRNQISNPLSLLRVQALDGHPRVRLEAIRACSFFEEARAAEVALEVLRQPTDYYLSYTLKQTLRTLQPFWLGAIRKGRPLAQDNQAGQQYLLARVDISDLINMPRSRAVYEALLARHQVLHKVRHEALMGLAKLNQTDMTTELLAAVQRVDQANKTHSQHVLNDLAHLLTKRPATEFSKHRGEIEKLAKSAQKTITRQVAYVTLITADKSTDAVWDDASQSANALRDLLGAVPLIPDLDLRRSMYTKVRPLLDEVPESLAASVADSNNPKASLRRAAIDAISYTGVNRSELFTLLVRFVQQGKARSASIRSLGRIPKNQWPEDQIQPLVDSIIEYLAEVPAKGRTSPAALDALALGNKLAAALPKAQAAEAREALGELGVNVIFVRPIPHRMQYDRNQLFVEAGKPVEIVFENADIMPHNLIITEPGALARVGIAAEAMAADPEAFAKQFIPDLSQVLHATGMLQPGQLERLRFTAPNDLGDYPYVCTFPGHWRTMYGTMHVVENFADVPAEALVPASDPEIQTRPFVHSWTLGELASDVSSAGRGRDYEQAKALFTAVSCVQCHRMNGQGGPVGPDLAEVRKKIEAKEYSRLNILEELVEPSKRIHEKYKTLVILDLEGRLHTGIVVHRDDNQVHLLANPLQSKEPTIIQINEIDDEFESKVSMMPAGLLNTLTKEEVLDLLAYLESGGDPEHKAFEQP